jgi:hypothetical protein
VSSAEPRTFARTVLTGVQNGSERCANPFCDKQREIKPRGVMAATVHRHAGWTAMPCDDQVGLVKFNDLLDQA